MIEAPYDPSTDRLLNQAEAALFLGVDRRSLRHWRKTGIGPPWISYLGSLTSAIRYRLSDLRAFLDARTTLAAEVPRPRTPTRVLPADKEIGVDAVRDALWIACERAGGMDLWAAGKGSLDLGAVRLSRMLDGRGRIDPEVAALLGFRCHVTVRYFRPHWKRARNNRKKTIKTS